MVRHDSKAFLYGVVALAEVSRDGQHIECTGTCGATRESIVLKIRVHENIEPLRNIVTAHVSNILPTVTAGAHRHLVPVTIQAITTKLLHAQNREPAQDQHPKVEVHVGEEGHTWSRESRQQINVHFPQRVSSEMPAIANLQKMS
jgi:hypothetical protein